METQDQIDYRQAKKQVKKIKGFYGHLIAYIVVNIFIILAQFFAEKNTAVFTRWETYATALFWGIGLIAHGLSVFLPNYIFSANWEERKIKQIMNKEKKRWE